MPSTSGATLGELGVLEDYTYFWIWGWWDITGEDWFECLHSQQIAGIWASLRPMITFTGPQTTANSDTESCFQLLWDDWIFGVPWKTPITLTRECLSGLDSLIKLNQSLTENPMFSCLAIICSYLWTLST